MNKIIFFCFMVFMASCAKNDSGKSKSFGDVMLDIANTDSFIVGKGIDSYIAEIITAHGDTFNIEYGKSGVIYSIYEPSPHVFPLKDKEEINKLAGKPLSDTEALFSEFAEQDEQQKIFDREYFLYDTINSIVVKLVQPKRIGKGITGIYVPKLKNGNSLSIYANNLDSAEHKKALQMFRTLRYKQ